jgi:hypothetical protein
VVQVVAVLIRMLRDQEYQVKVMRVELLLETMPLEAGALEQ